MKVEQLYTNCLAEAAYYIESEGEVAIIDPLRETEPYLRMAEESGTKIKYIFETHFHADFVSGHIDLAKKTGAKIIYGPNANPDYDVYSANDGEVFQLGKVQIKVLHTPGHTLESTTYLLLDEAGKENAIFTGDTLFIGDVGRPDLAIKSDLTKEDLAALLYDSLRNKIMTLPDDVIVYPGHGAGSACGKNMSKETTDTLGNQKQTNYALRKDMTKEEFVAEVIEGILPPPQYFAKNAALNKAGYESVDTVISRGMQALSAEDFDKAHKDGALLLDVRHQNEFHKGYIPGSLFIGLDGMFAIWVGTIITNINQPIILVTPEGREEETVLRLARVGYDNTLGYLKGGFEAWKASGMPVETINSIPATELAEKMKQGDIDVLDVRKEGEYQSEHIENVQHLALDYLQENLDQVASDKTYHVHCAGGYRSMIASSILKSKGINVIDVAGGFKAIKDTDIKVTDYVCPTTLAKA